MMKNAILFLSVSILSVSPFEATMQDADTITVDRMAFCTEVVDREPQGEATEFDTTVETVYCFTALNGPEGAVVHAWYHADSLRFQITLDKGKAGRWRTWSSKRMSAAWQGEWRVDVLDEEGGVLKSATFIYGNVEN
ncbi:MAG: DUF2914 domain-containing protein [candidate division KSB1 bacterium]|nr:DUF2914 domain-containing protein [candidate division KSB1 bacterium]